MSDRRSYSEKLLDPRWQRRRLETLDRDGWACRACGDKDNTLHVHHRWYHGEPWDAPEEALVTLCADCHREEGEYRRGAEGVFLHGAKKVLMWRDLVRLIDTLEAMPPDAVRSLVSLSVDPTNLKPLLTWIAARHAAHVMSDTPVRIETSVRLAENLEEFPFLRRPLQEAADS